MLFTQYQMTRIVVICMTTALSGCAVRPGLSFPISVSKAVNGEVVSLKSVAQGGQAAFYQSARSVRTPQHWPQPNRQSVAMPPSHPVPFRSHPVRRSQQQHPAYQANQRAMPLVTSPQQAMMRRSDQPQRVGQFIQQVAQQQTPPPIVIQWDDHKQSTGSTRTFSTSTFNTPVNVAPQAMGTQASQGPEPFCPPEVLPAHTTRKLGDGCGESGQTVDFEQINKLVQRVEKMETELSSSNKSIKNLTSSLASARIEISQMKRDVAFWQSEVVRLERSMKAQHRTDIASLNQISKVLETLLTEEDGGDPVFDDVPPDFDVAVDPFAPVSR